MTQFFLVLGGTNKHSAGLIQYRTPRGDFPFQYDEAQNSHILHGRDLSLEEFEAASRAIYEEASPLGNAYNVFPRVIVPAANELRRKLDEAAVQLDEEKRSHLDASEKAATEIARLTGELATVREAAAKVEARDREQIELLTRRLASEEALNASLNEELRQARESGARSQEAEIPAAPEPVLASKPKHAPKRH